MVRVQSPHSGKNRQKAMVFGAERRLVSVCRKKDVFAGWGRPPGLAADWNTRLIASNRRLISLGMPQSALVRGLGA
jgi:hypothetical protein